MRQYLLTLTLLTFPGWSQPAQQPAQPPIVVHVQMPPTNPWTHILELVVPGTIGIASALIAVWLTQRHQRRLEVHKAEIAAKYKSEDNRWEFKKDVYVNLVTSITDCSAAIARFYEIKTLFPEGCDDKPNELWQQIIDEHHVTFKAAVAQYVRYANLAPLAASHDVHRIVFELDKQLPPLFTLNPQHAASLDILQAFNDARIAIRTAAYTDLWGENGTA